MWFATYMTGVVASLVASVYYSVTARQRGTHPLASRMILGKMNISLGVLVSLFGLNQFSFDDLDTIRIVVGLLLLFVGVMNLVLGTRNYLRYRSAWMAEMKKSS
ncbi:YtpI family protein [Brevibacillus composti]|uniref:YtpI family protein n=1 Tax=Brevibacillus composti TaxID=2796470 RepID=A0A7T5JMX5_9BACL|nr:YtpI family protein [Brevibacillus composti]QQE73547.1 YtpI family protein [Brevibacillus composti]QUO40629.1 YtpI family protein [Brevibacillus composti]